MKPRHPTPEDVQANLLLCEHEVARLRAEVAALQAARRQLEGRVNELQCLVAVLENRMAEEGED